MQNGTKLSILWIVWHEGTLQGRSADVSDCYLYLQIFMHYVTRVINIKSYFQLDALLVLPEDTKPAQRPDSPQGL